ncbi:MAG: signal recognition particle-docking protein FtsY [Pseudomonadota bacterium]
MQDDTPANESEAAPAEEGGFWGRLRSGLSKTREQLAEGVGNLILGEREIDDEVLEDLETALLMTDVGVDTTTDIMSELAGRVRRKELNNTRALHRALAGLLTDRLQPLEAPLAIEHHPHVVFFVGVNGVGKTTTIGKLAKQLQSQGREVLLAAGDTFRAAAVEQLQVWGERNNVPVIAQAQGSDSASVVFDAVQAAQARGVDVLLVDTAGRLQDKAQLMDELKKVHRVVARLDASAPHDVVLVLDAGVGQNALSQVALFHAAVAVSGLVLTKLDGTAKAGVLFAIANHARKEGIDLPVHYIGVGEGVDDLRPFVAREFVDALLADDGLVEE